MRKNMEICHAMMSACVSVSEMMKKNQYYTSEDLKHAMKIACSIVYGNNDNIKLLKIGNHKLSNNVMIWDIPEIITCKYNCSHCYAVKSSRMYANTRRMRLYHVLLLESACRNDDIKQLIMGMMYDEIKTFAEKNMGMVFVRLHSAGDIYNKDYLQFILELVNKCKDIKSVKFYTYTKQLEHAEIDEINKNYTNFNIVKSILHGDNNKNYINFGNDEYIKEVKKHVKDVFVCSYGTGNQATCMGTCMACAFKSHVCFHQH